MQTICKATLNVIRGICIIKKTLRLINKQLVVHFENTTPLGARLFGAASFVVALFVVAHFVA